MAEFNPQLNEKDTNYLNYSRGTDRAIGADIKNLPNLQVVDFGTQKADTSTGELLGNVAKIGAGAIAAVDDIIKTTATEQVRQGVEQIRGQFTQDIAGAIGNPLEVQTGAVIPSNSNSDIPQALQQGIERTPKQLSSAKAAGKLTEAGYWLQLDNFARTMRERYPGHKDFIDQKIAGYTGGNPANMLWRSQLSALQAQAARAQNSATADARFIQRNAQHLTQSQRDALLSGDPTKRPSTNELMKTIWDNKAVEESLKRKNVLLGIAEKERTLTKQQTEDFANDTAVAAVKRFEVDFFNSPAGKELDKTLSTSRDQLTSQDLTKGVELFAAYRAKIEAGVDQLLNSTRTVAEPSVGETGPELRYSGPSIAAKLGAEGVKRVKELALSNVKVIEDNFFSTKGGIVPWMKSMNDLQGDERYRRALQENPQLQVMEVFRRAGGDRAVDSYITNNGGLKALTKLSANFVQHGTLTNDPNQHTQSTREDKAKLMSYGLTPASNPTEFAQRFDQPINNILSKDMSPEIKAKSIDKLTHVDSQQDFATLGTHSQNVIYAKMTTPEFVRNMVKLRETNPASWDRYVEFLKNKFVPLYRDPMGAVERNNADPRSVTIGYDSKAKKFFELPPTPEQKANINRNLGVNNPTHDIPNYDLRDPNIINIRKPLFMLNAGIQQILPVLEADAPNYINVVLHQLFSAGGLQLLKPSENK